MRKQRLDYFNSVAPLSLAVETSPGKYHAYWFTHGMPLERFTPFQKELASVFGGDPVPHDLPRIMRVPGFTHWKGAPFLSRICYVSEPKRRRKADYVLPDVLERALKKTGKKFGAWDAPGSTRPRRRARPNPGKSPDLFNCFPHTPENETLIRDAVNYIPAGPRDNWWKAGAALHALGWDNARELWDEWSQTAPEKFDPEDQNKTWNGYQDREDGITYLTILDMAYEHGWEPETAAPAGNGHDVGAIPRQERSTGVWACSLIRAVDVVQEPISWLWIGWLARGKLHIIAGSPGTAKTTIGMKVAAVISCGGSWPDNTSAPQGNVIIWSGEDSISDTLTPRLRVAGADMGRIFFVGPMTCGEKKRSFDPAKDMAALQHVIEDAGGASLVILDPIVAAARTDSHKNAETRRDLQPVVDMAEELNVAILGVHHLTKGTEGRAPIDRITGSVAFGAVPRVVWASVQQKADEEGNPGSRVLTRAKSNLGPDQGGWAYELQIVTLSLNQLIDATVVVFGKFVDGSARDILAEAEGTVDPGAASAQQEATDFLRDFLGTGARPAKLAQTEARGAGHSPRTLARAKSRLGVRSVKGSLYGGWLWELPKDAKSP